MTEPKRTDMVLIRWKVRGCCIVDGMGYPRSKGDEDVVKYCVGRAWERCGSVDVIGTSADIPPVLETVKPA